MPERDIDDRLREVEEYCHSHEAQIQERWTNQFHLNKKTGERMEAIEKSCQMMATNLKVNTVKITAIFIVVQVVIGAVAVAVVKYIITGQP